jgi:hypothetical protein
MGMTMLLRRMKIDATVHGFHSSFRDWAAECTSFAHEVCEMAPAHVVGTRWKPPIGAVTCSTSDGR